MRRNKFHVAPKADRTYKGIVFDSKSEMNRYKELEFAVLGGVIRDLQRQVKYEVIPATEWSKPVYYVADFVYYDVEKNRDVIEDKKGVITAVFKRKWKIMQKRYKDYFFLIT